MKAGSAALVIAAGSAIDLAVKAWARASLEPYGPPLDFLPLISLRLTFNEGVSFSILVFDHQGAKIALLGFTALLTSLLTIWAFRTRGYERLALSAIVSGALANLIDRAAYGAVTDFLGLHFGNWHPFVFNLADVWISGGVVLLLITHWQSDWTAKKTSSKLP